MYYDEDDDDGRGSRRSSLRSAGGVSPRTTARSTTPRAGAEKSKDARMLLDIRTQVLQLEGHVELLQSQVKEMPFEVRDLLVSTVADQNKAMQLIQAKIASTPDDVRAILSKALAEQRKDVDALQNQLQTTQKDIAHVQTQLMGLPAEVRQFVGRLSADQEQRVTSVEDSMKTLQLQVRGIVNEQVGEVLTKQAEALDQASKLQAQREAAVVQAVQAQDKALKARATEVRDLHRALEDQENQIQEILEFKQELRSKVNQIDAIKQEIPSAANILDVRKEFQADNMELRKELQDIHTAIRKVEEAGAQASQFTKNALKKSDVSTVEIRQRLEAQIQEMKKHMDEYLYKLDEWKAQQQTNEVRELRRIVMEGSASPRNAAEGGLNGRSQMEKLEQSLRGHEMAMKQAQMAQQTEALHVRAHLQMQQALREKDEEIRELTLAAIKGAAVSEARPRRLSLTEGARSEDKPRSPRAPEALLVAAPNVKQGVSGQYDLMHNQLVHNYPIWKLRGASRWLFTGVSGQWLIGDQVEKNADFRVDTGIVASMEEHNGVMPDKIGQGDWQRFDGAQWHEDFDLTIKTLTAGPRRFSAATAAAGHGLAPRKDPALLDAALVLIQKVKSAGLRCMKCGEQKPEVMVCRSKLTKTKWMQDYGGRYEDFIYVDPQDETGLYSCLCEDHVKSLGTIPDDAAYAEAATSLADDLKTALTHQGGTPRRRSSTKIPPPADPESPQPHQFAVPSMKKQLPTAVKRLPTSADSGEVF